MGDDDTTPDVPEGPEPYDPSGLNLARDIARSYKNTPNRPARRSKPSSGAGRGSQPPDPGQPQQISDIMARLVQQRGWEKDLAVHRVFTEWPAVVGQDVAEHCVPVEYVDGEVTVQADSTAWATQITLLAPRIVAKLNEQLGDGTVVRINVKAPNGPTWKKGFRTVRGQRGPRDTYG